MCARLGDVLYLLGCALGVLWLVSAVEVMGDTPVEWQNVLFYVLIVFAPAMIFWLAGTACLYVLRGDAEIGVLPVLSPRRVVALLQTVSGYAISIGILVTFVFVVRKLGVFRFTHWFSISGLFGFS